MTKKINPFRALRHRNFRLFFFGQLISLIGTWMQQTALGWLVYQMTGSKIWLGLIPAISSAPMVACSIFGGSLADRHSKRTIMFWTQSISMILALILALLVYEKWETIWWFALIGALGGVTLGFDMPARQSFFVEITNREDLMNAISLNSTIVNAARIIGPAIAGLILAHFGAATCFLFNGLSFTALLIGLLLMRLDHVHIKKHEGSALKHAWEGLVYVRNHRRVFIILSLFAIVGIFGWSYAVLLPAMATDILHLDEKGYGFLVSFSGLGALVGALIVATIGNQVRPRYFVLGGVWIFSAAIFLFSWSQTFFWSVVYLFIAGLGMMLFFATSNTLVQTVVQDDMRGRVMGVWAFIFGAMMPLGSLEAGFLAHWWGAPHAIAFGAVICACMAGWTLWYVTAHPPATGRY
jgi:MFS family permease